MSACGMSPAPEGVTDLAAAKKAVGPKTAALVIQTPNFYGCLEDVAAAAEIAHAAGALLVVVADPVNLGVLEGPGKLGADIVVGEGQGLGVPMCFGGPNLGVFAAKNDLVRRMPGRLVGATVDRDGERGFVLTLQTREQHIRRAKATSNICTNVALCALMATIYLATLGRGGSCAVGELSAAKAHYAAERLATIPGVSLRFAAPFFKEFALKLPKSPERVAARLARQGILAGVPLKTFDREPGRLPAGRRDREAHEGRDRRASPRPSRRRWPDELRCLRQADLRALLAGARGVLAGRRRRARIRRPQAPAREASAPGRAGAARKCPSSTSSGTTRASRA